MKGFVMLFAVHNIQYPEFLAEITGLSAQHLTWIYHKE